MACGSASSADSAANNQYQQWEKSALSNYNTAMSGYNNNLSTMEGQGNPYTSKSFLTNQNLLTSGAMNANNMKAKQQLQDTALRTGENTAAINDTIADSARQGQRTMDQYNAQAANDNEDKYLQYEQGLLHDRLAGADSEAGILGTTTQGSDAALGDLTNADDAEMGMWGQIIGGAAAGAGAAYGGG
jgi:hypothetical protein